MKCAPCFVPVVKYKFLKDRITLCYSYHNSLENIKNAVSLKKLN